MKTFFPILILLSFLLNASISMGQTGEAQPDQKFYERNNRHGLKLSLSSLFNDVSEYIDVSYEYSKTDRRSFLVSVGVLGFNRKSVNYYSGIGLGTAEIISYPKVGNGVFFKVATRFYSSSMKPKHFKMAPNVFRGFYFEPEFILGFYQRNYFDYSIASVAPFSSFVPVTPELITKNVNYQAVMVNFGRQGVLEKVVLIDFSFGIGFALDNLERVKNDDSQDRISLFITEGSDFSQNQYKHGPVTKQNGSLSLAANVSLRIGGIF